MALSSMQNMSLCCGASPPPPRATKAQGMWDVYSAEVLAAHVALEGEYLLGRHQLFGRGPGDGRHVRLVDQDLGLELVVELRCAAVGRGGLLGNALHDLRACAGGCSLLKMRTVPSSTASPEMMLNRAPEWSVPTVTTMGSSGLNSRLDIVCSAHALWPRQRRWRRRPRRGARRGWPRRSTVKLVASRAAGWSVRLGVMQSEPAGSLGEDVHGRRRRPRPPATPWAMMRLRAAAPAPRRAGTCSLTRAAELVLHGGEYLRRAQQHGRVRVVAAGVHDSPRSREA